MRLKCKAIQRVAVVILSLILVASTFMTIPVYGAVNEEVKAPDIKSKAGILYCINTDETLYSKNADKKIDPYSITKLMTALIAAENLDLDKKVVTDEAATKLGGSTMFLTKGEKVTVEQLLYGTLVMSGNDAAHMLAVATSGSEKEFVKLMNKRAEELGCTNTHFMNAHGLKAKNHYTTAADYVKIAQAAFSNETVLKVAGTRKYHMPATNISDDWYMKTHVDLLDKDGSGVIAGKTGYWEDDDCSVVLMYDKAGLKTILVLLGSEIKQRPKDAKKILEYGTKKIVSVEAVAKDEPITSTLIKHGEKTRVNVCTDQTVLAYPIDGQKSSISRTCEIDSGLEAPLKKGDVVGSCTYTTDGYEVATVPLMLSEDVNVGWFPSYFYISNTQSIILGSVFGLLVIILLARKIKMRRNKEEEYEAKH